MEPRETDAQSFSESVDAGQAEVDDASSKAPSTEHRAPSTEHRAPSTEHRAPKVKKQPVVDVSLVIRGRSIQITISSKRKVMNLHSVQVKARYSGSGLKSYVMRLSETTPSSDEQSKPLWQTKLPILENDKLLEVSAISVTKNNSREVKFNQSGNQLAKLGISNQPDYEQAFFRPKNRVPDRETFLFQVTQEIEDSIWSLQEKAPLVVIFGYGAVEQASVEATQKAELLLEEVIKWLPAFEMRKDDHRVQPEQLELSVRMALLHCKLFLGKHFEILDIASDARDIFYSVKEAAHGFHKGENAARFGFLLTLLGAVSKDESRVRGGVSLSESAIELMRKSDMSHTTLAQIYKRAKNVYAQCLEVANEPTVIVSEMGDEIFNRCMKSALRLRRPSEQTKNIMADHFREMLQLYCKQDFCKEKM